jgi:quercetin 2,3-dioxygenase
MARFDPLARRKPGPSGPGIVIDRVKLLAGDAVILLASSVSLSTVTSSDLVLITTDETAPVFTGGMFSGNIL